MAYQRQCSIFSNQLERLTERDTSIKVGDFIVQRPHVQMSGKTAKAYVDHQQKRHGKDDTPVRTSSILRNRTDWRKT